VNIQALKMAMKAIEDEGRQGRATYLKGRLAKKAPACPDCQGEMKCEKCSGDADDGEGALLEEALQE
jgi:hypothetical protein